MTKKQANDKPLTLELTAILIFALGIIGHLSVIKYAEGYYRHFGVTLPDINFVPELYDYVNVLPITLIASAIVVLVAYLLIRVGVLAGDLLGEKTEPSKWLERSIKLLARHELFVKVLVRGLQWVMRILIVIVFLWALDVVSNISVGSGQVNAEARINYSSTSAQADAVQKVIIYKNDGGITLKSYDTMKRKFLDGYEAISGASYTTRSVRL